MSFKAMAWAASVKTNTPIQKLILLMLADKANDDGFCWPKMQTIANDCCMSRKCVLENVKKLAAGGFVLVEKRTVKAEEGRNHNCAHMYKVMVGTAPLGYTRVTNGDFGRVTESYKHGNPELQTRVTEGYNKNLSVEPINEPIVADAPESLENKSNSKPRAEGSSSPAPLAPPDFEQAWASYGRKGNKQTALRYWNKLAQADKDAIKAKIPAYIAAREMTYRKDFQGWINPANRMWEDAIVSKNKPDFIGGNW